MTRLQLLFAAIAVLALALALRLVFVFTSPLTTDESFTWRVIQYPWGDMVNRVAEDGHAPMHFILLKAGSALTGRSLIGMRVFSLLCYSLATVIQCVAMRAALHLHGVATGQKSADFEAEMLLLLAMLAFNPLQMFVASNARMYSLGMLFVSLSTWAFLAALNTSGRYSTLLWTLWGALSGAGMLTHHFVGFVTAGQVFAGLWIMLRQNVRPERKILPQLGYLMIGCLTAIVVYSPWLSVIRDQFAEVGRDFWISPLTLHGVVGLLSSWLTGQAAEDWTTSYVLLSSLVATSCIAIGLWKRPLATMPFACMALVPWFLCIGISLAMDRPLLQDRYLVFGQASALTAACLGWGSIKGVAWRVAAGALLLASHFIGGASDPALFDPREDTFARCVDSVLAHDDGKCKTIVVHSPADVNRTRYFLDRANRHDFQVKLFSNSPYRIGHISHIAALESAEVYWSSAEQLRDMRDGVWIIYDQQGDSAMGGLGTADVIEEHEIHVRDSASGRVILVRSPQKANSG